MAVMQMPDELLNDDVRRHLINSYIILMNRSQRETIVVN